MIRIMQSIYGIKEHKIAIQRRLISFVSLGQDERVPQGRLHALQGQPYFPSHVALGMAGIRSGRHNSWTTTISLRAKKQTVDVGLTLTTSGGVPSAATAPMILFVKSSFMPAFRQHIPL